MTRLLAGALLASTLFAAPALAQTEAAAPATEPAPATVKIAALTTVDFVIVDELRSNTAKIDQFFTIRLRNSIRVGGMDVVPAGTLGQGQVIHAAKSGWGGKAGELIVTARYIEFRGVKIPLRRFRMGEPETGDSRVLDAALASAAVPLAGFLVSGGEKIIMPGTGAHAIVSADTEVPAPGAPTSPAKQGE